MACQLVSVLLFYKVLGYVTFSLRIAGGNDHHMVMKQGTSIVHSPLFLVKLCSLVHSAVMSLTL